MEALVNGLTLEIPEGCFPLSTDSMALADFAKLPRNARVLDLGSGCGTLGTLLCSRDSGCHVTGVETDPLAHQAALENICRNRLEIRMESLCLDLRSLSAFLQPGSFQCCVSNPPYFSAGPASLKLSTARREDLCSAEDLFTAAAWALKFGGDFFLVHRPERLGELIAQGSRRGFACKRLTLLHHRQGGQVNLILLQFRKGAKEGLLLKEESLYDSLGNPTEVYQRIYHLEEA